jgi:hypothetical protein
VPNIWAFCARKSESCQRRTLTLWCAQLFINFWYIEICGPAKCQVWFRGVRAKIKKHTFSKRGVGGCRREWLGSAGWSIWIGERERERERESTKKLAALLATWAPPPYTHTNLREIYSHTFLWLAASRVEEKIKKRKNRSMRENNHTRSRKVVSFLLGSLGAPRSEKAKIKCVCALTIFNNGGGWRRENVRQKHVI